MNQYQTLISKGLLQEIEGLGVSTDNTLPNNPVTGFILQRDGVTAHISVYDSRSGKYNAYVSISSTDPLAEVYRTNVGNWQKTQAGLKETDTKMSFNVSKDVKKIAKDFERKLFPCIAIMKKLAIAAKQDKDAYNNQINDNVTALGFERKPEGSPYQDEYKVPGGKVKITTYIEFTVTVSAVKAKEILAILNK